LYFSHRALKWGHTKPFDHTPGLNYFFDFVIWIDAAECLIVGATKSCEKDLFVFSCYTGISYVEIVQLTEDNIVIGIDGSPWIMANRVKTGAPFKIPLLPKAAILIDKYKDHYRTNDTSCLLPKLSNQKLNSYLKEIADL